MSHHAATLAAGVNAVAVAAVGPGRADCVDGNTAGTGAGVAGAAKVARVRVHLCARLALCVTPSQALRARQQAFTACSGQGQATTTAASGDSDAPSAQDAAVGRGAGTTVAASGTLLCAAVVDPRVSLVLVAPPSMTVLQFGRDALRRLVVRAFSLWPLAVRWRSGGASSNDAHACTANPCALVYLDGACQTMSTARGPQLAGTLTVAVVRGCVPALVPPPPNAVPATPVPRTAARVWVGASVSVLPAQQHIGDAIAGAVADASTATATVDAHGNVGTQTTPEQRTCIVVCACHSTALDCCPPKRSGACGVLAQDVGIEPWPGAGVLSVGFTEAAAHFTRDCREDLRLCGVLKRLDNSSVRTQGTVTTHHP